MLGVKKFAYGRESTDDITRPHPPQVTMETVDSLRLKVLPHPTWSPDLAPSDYHLLGPMKKTLGGQKFASDMEVQWVIRQWHAIAELICLHQAFTNLLKETWDKCFDKHGGVYIWSFKQVKFTHICLTCSFLPITPKLNNVAAAARKYFTGWLCVIMTSYFMTMKSSVQKF